MAIKVKPTVASANAPYLPPIMLREVVYAVRALSKGQADPGQQVLALQWIRGEVCKEKDMSYRPESTRDSDFAEGKRYVALQLERAIERMTAAQIDKLPSISGPGSKEDDEIKDM
jgi:hypothetical protein